MDDIARDPHADAQAAPAEPSRLRLKGPVPEFAVEETVEEDAENASSGRADRPEAERDDRITRRLPRVLPLSPADDSGDDDDLLGAPAVAPALSPAAGTEVSALASLAEGEPEDPERIAEAGEDGPDDGSGPGADAVSPVRDQSIAADSALPTLAEPIADPEKLARVVFGLLLTNRDGLSALRLAQVCDTTQDAVRGALESLVRDLAAMRTPLELTQSGESFKLWTTPEVFPYLEKLRGIKKNERLSPAALETLAVIAYRQPVFRAEIEAIRGVKAGPMLRSLLDCKLVKVVGRADVPGRPLQYGTTQQFLERFGLTALTDLPSVKEFKGLSG